MAKATTANTQIKRSRPSYKGLFNCEAAAHEATKMAHEKELDRERAKHMRLPLNFAEAYQGESYFPACRLSRLVTAAIPKADGTPRKALTRRQLISLGNKYDITLIEGK